MDEFLSVTVYLWSCRLDSIPSANDLPNLFVASEQLSRKERGRAERFRFERDRDRFVQGHRFMRAVLSLHLQRPAAEITFETTKLGKPNLVAHPSWSVASGELKLGHFSYSASGSYAACAYCQHGPVGVDIEVPRRNTEIEEVAQAIFSSREMECWNQTPLDQRFDRFYEAWTRKEAIGKMAGTGISNGPQSISIPWATESERVATKLDRFDHPGAVLSDWRPYSDGYGCMSLQLIDGGQMESLTFEQTRVESGGAIQLKDVETNVPPGCSLWVREFKELG